MFKKFRKESETKTRKHYFIKEDIPKLYKYVDKSKSGSYLDKYYLWEFIHKSLMIDIDSKTHLCLKTHNILKPYVLETYENL